jgi:hypothetical protein
MDGKAEGKAPYITIHMSSVNSDGSQIGGYIRVCTYVSDKKIQNLRHLKISIADIYYFSERKDKNISLNSHFLCVLLIKHKIV